MSDESPTHLNRRTMLKGAIASVATLPAAAALVHAAGVAVAGLREAVKPHAEFLYEMAGKNV